jgi:hypothetical protein
MAAAVKPHSPFCYERVDLNLEIAGFDHLTAQVTELTGAGSCPELPVIDFGKPPGRNGFLRLPKECNRIHS